MNSPASNRVESLFALAAELPRDSRESFLNQECGGDEALRRQLNGLLQAHDRVNHPIDRPAVQQDRLEPTYLSDVPAVGTVIAGRYKLLEQIGEGGMGTVWVAEQSEPVKRKVALKLIKAGMDSKAVLARFEAERQALAMMDHPNIAKVLDGGLTDAGRPYFVMEYVKGVPITEYCDALKLSVPERLELFVQVCSAVQHAHQKGIIHRDLKPSNILVAPYDDKPVPKVIDFGLAKALHQRLTDRTLHTAHETVIGTPLYMSPEQAQLNNLDVDTRSDVYSLGVLLYELLTGTTPIEKVRFKEAAWDEIRRIIREEEPPRPSTRISSVATLPSLAACRQADPSRLTQQVRGELDWIAMKALDKERTRRYDTAIGLAKDVQRYLKGETVEACPPSLGYRVKKAYRRNKPVVLVTAAFVGLITGAAVMGAVLAVRAEQARRGEVAERQRAEDREAEAITQRLRAEQEQKRAEEEKRAAEAVRTFLQDDLLRQADVIKQADSMPMAGGEFEIKHNPTVRELLDRAAIHLTPERIEQKFPGMPFVQAEVLHAVADAYWGVAEDERGRALIDRAVALYRATRGDLDAATLKARKSQLQLSSLLPAEQYDALLASYIEDATQVFGPKDRQVLEGRIHLANRLVARKRPAEAIPGLKKLRTELTELLGPTDVLTLTCGAHIALAYAQDKQFLAAVREMESLRETGKGMAVRFDHPLALEGCIMLADFYRASGNIQKAIEVYEEILDNWKQRGQPYNGNTWAPRHLLAWIYARNGNLAKGAELFEANVAAAPTSFNTYLSLSALLEAEVKLGRDNKALVERARQGLSAAIGIGGGSYKSWVTGHARIRLGQQLLRTMQYAEAEKLLTAGLREMIDEYPHIRDYSLNAIPEGHRSLLDLYRVTNRPENERNWLGETLEMVDTLVTKKLAEGKFTPDLATLMEIQIFNLIAAGRHDDAVAVYREANTNHTPSSKAAADAWLRISGIVLNGYEGKLQLDRMKPWAELRIPAHERNLDALRKTKPSEQALVPATNSLLFSYLYAGRKADVVRLTQEVIDRQQANGWLTDAQTVGFYGSTAKAVALAGRPDLAVKISSEVLAVAQKSNPSADVLATATFSLGFARSYAGEHAEAEGLFREAVRLQTETETDVKHWKAAKYKAWLGFALHDQQKYADAEPVLLEAYEEWAQCLPDTPAWEKYHPLLAAGRLASLYEAIGKPSEAEKWKTLCDQN